ncbi:MAG: 5'-3' exonuclease [Solirubrobacteraceae bacterium]
MSGPLLVVDAPFLLYRSFFALPETITDGQGHSVGALLGATNVLLRIAAELSPRALVLCFGAEAADYRVALYPGYHAHRPPVAPALAWQLEAAPEYFAPFGWSSATDASLEADDLLGSLARTEASARGQTLILTGDRDMYQCASELTTILYLKQGSVGFEAVDPAEVKRRYGVVPALVPDFIALRGDPSDGLPGAPGIGPKTAAALLARHGSLPAVIAAAAGERPRIAAALQGAAQELLAFADIATLRAVELERPEDRQTSLEGGARAARRWGMNRLAQRLEGAEKLSDL